MKKFLMAAATVALLAPAMSAFDGHGKHPHFDTMKMSKILAMQSDEMQARYQYRHPKETLKFFGVTPGMMVADVLPSKEWYAGILLPYLGEEGMLVGVDYAESTWIGYKGDAEDTPEFLAKRKSWPERWTKAAQEWRGEGDAQIRGVNIDDVPADLAGKVDVVMMMRATHLPHRFNGEVAKLFENALKLLKPGGVLGIVQHRAPEESSDSWANGNAGYLKQSTVIAAATAAGFKLEETSEINANPKDKPTEDDIVWRLPPSLDGTKEGTAERASVLAIGESDRMTLRFRKAK